MTRRTRKPTVKRRPKNRQTDERLADLSLWTKDGSVFSYDARVEADTEVSIGRTNSKRALGFVVSRGDTQMDFVLMRGRAWCVQVDRE
jgi:hypothetical protein